MVGVSCPRVILFCRTTTSRCTRAAARARSTTTARSARPATRCGGGGEAHYPSCNLFMQHLFATRWWELRGWRRGAVMCGASTDDAPALRTVCNCGLRCSLEQIEI